MKRKIFNIIITCILIGLLTACHRNNTTSLAPIQDNVNKSDYIYGLIKSNNYCDFPCYWGIIPSQTISDSAIQYLSSFSERTIYNESESKFIYLNSNTNVNDEKIIVSIFANEKLIDHIIVDTNNIKIDDYSFKEIIRKYKTPSKVKIMFVQTSKGNWEIQLFAIYSNNSFSALYSSTSSKINENKEITICLKDDAYFYFWPKNEQRSEEIYNFPDDILTDIENVSNIALTDLSKIQTNESGDYCLTLTVPDYLLP